MIPKRIFQTAKEPLSPHILRRLRPYIHGWEYEFYTDQEIIDWLYKNPLPEFPNAVERFQSFSIGQHRADFFRYYYLYINGGIFLDSDAMIYMPLDNIVSNYDFVTVEQHPVLVDISRPRMIFQGFLGAIPLHPIMYMVLKHAYFTPIEEINQAYNIFCEYMYTAIQDSSNTSLRSEEHTSELQSH